MHYRNNFASTALQRPHCPTSWRARKWWLQQDLASSFLVGNVLQEAGNFMSGNGSWWWNTFFICRALRILLLWLAVSLMLWNSSGKLNLQPIDCIVDCLRSSKMSLSRSACNCWIGWLWSQRISNTFLQSRKMHVSWKACEASPFNGMLLMRTFVESMMDFLVESCSIFMATDSSWDAKWIPSWKKQQDMHSDSDYHFLLCCNCMSFCCWT